MADRARGRRLPAESCRRRNVDTNGVRARLLRDSGGSYRGVTRVPLAARGRDTPGRWSASGERVDRVLSRRPLTFLGRGVAFPREPWGVAVTGGVEVVLVEDADEASVAVSD